MKKVAFRHFNPREDMVWNALFKGQAEKRNQQIFEIFDSGVNALHIPENKVPDIEKINFHLKALTGFIGVPVEGLEDPLSFFEMLARREFPIGNFIREAKDLSYTPAPDIFHDLYGHLPFLADTRYADFCHDMGLRALKFKDKADLFRQWERLFWFAVEFSLVETPKGTRIFGAGIASSKGECEYALSDLPNVVPFNVEDIRKRDYHIDEFQGTLYKLKNPEELYECLDAFEAGCR